MFQVIWRKVDDESDSYTRIINDENYQVHLNGSLSIIDVQEDNEGTYSVEISNGNETTSVMIQIIVLQRTGSCSCINFYSLLDSLN